MQPSFCPLSSFLERLIFSAAEPSAGTDPLERLVLPSSSFFYWKYIKTSCWELLTSSLIQFLLQNNFCAAQRV